MSDRERYDAMPLPAGYQAQIVRTPQEVQRAHDILVNLIVDEELREAVTGAEDSRRTLRALMNSADVLCWLLGHDHNRNFAENLEGLQEFLLARGYILIDTGELHWRRREDDFQG
jgi:hypothetical protein